MFWVLTYLLASGALFCWMWQVEVAHQSLLNDRLKRRLDNLTAEQRRDVHAWLAEHDDESHYQ